MTGSSAGLAVRRVELLAVLSLGADLGLGQPMEHVLRECLIAMRLAERLGLDERARAVVCYTALLTWVGCHVDAYEQAKWFGDDLAFKADFPLVDAPGTGFVLRHLGAGRPFLDRARLGVALVGDRGRQVGEIIDNHRRAAESLAAALGLDREVRDSLGQAFERWDGKGTPGRARGTAISTAARLVSIADVVEVFHRLGGVPAAVEVARQRRGTQFDPALVDAFCRDAGELLPGVESAGTWDAVVAAEPALDAILSGDELDAALTALANFIDVKSPYTLGHSAAIAELAGAATRVAGLPAADAVLARRAGLVHDLGRLGVSNAVWDKPGALTGTGRNPSAGVSECDVANVDRLEPAAVLLVVGAHRFIDQSAFGKQISKAQLAVFEHLLDLFRRVRGSQAQRDKRYPSLFVVEIVPRG